MGKGKERLGRGWRNAGPYPSGSVRRFITQVAVRIGRPIEEVAAYDARQLATIVEVLNGSKDL
jgi:hypothetical protein